MLAVVLTTLTGPMYPAAMPKIGVVLAPALSQAFPTLYFAWMVIAAGGIRTPWVAWPLWAMFLIASTATEYLFGMASLGSVAMMVLCVLAFFIQCNRNACFTAAATFGVVAIGFAGLRLLQNWGTVEGYIPSAIAPVFTVASSVVMAGAFRLVPSLVWHFFATDDVPKALMVAAMGNATAFTFALRLSRMMAAPEAEATFVLAVSAVSIVVMGLVARTAFPCRVGRAVLRKMNLQDHWIYKFLIIDKVKDLTMRQSLVMSLVPGLFALPSMAIAYASGAPWARRASVWAAIPIYLGSAVLVDLILVLAHRRLSTWWGKAFGGRSAGWPPNRARIGRTCRTKRPRLRPNGRTRFSRAPCLG
uniref:Uncharacterized protein n=1 Tax=Zooxanthella nutricula TaxID=1333877 RepID=A0A7S2J748_9DINO